MAGKKVFLLQKPSAEKKMVIQENKKTIYTGTYWFNCWTHSSSKK